MSNAKPSPGWSSDPYRAGSIALIPLPALSAPGASTRTSTGPPITPICWADTPTQASPRRRISSCSVAHSGSASTPPLTLSHSTITVPLNRAGSAGRRTSTRVRYGTCASGSNDQRPSPVSGAADRYDVAVPAATYSCRTYPRRFRFTAIGEPMKTPLPPVSACGRSAAGPPAPPWVVTAGAVVADQPAAATSAALRTATNPRRRRPAFPTPHVPRGFLTGAPPPGSGIRSVVAVDLTTLHHEPHVLDDADVVQRVAGHADDVGEQTGGETPAVVGVDELGRHRGRGADGLQRRHPAVDQREQLLGVAAVGDRRGVRPAGDPGTALDRLLDRLARAGEDLGRLGLQLGGGPREIHPVGQVRGGDEEGAALYQQLERLVAHERPVLDAVDAGFDRGADAVVAVGMGGDLETGAVCLVDDDAELLVGVLLRARGSRVRHDPARCAHLDQLRTVLDLVADGLAHLADSVGDALFDRQRHDVRRERLEHRRVEVPTGRRDGVPRGDDPRPVDPAEVDGLLQCHVQQQPARLHEQAEVPDRREPGAQRPAGVPDGAECPHGGVVLHRVERALAVAAAEEEVHLHVHQPREEREISDVDGHRVVGHGRRRDVDDPLTVDEEPTGVDDLASVDVEQAGAAEVDGRRRRSRGRHAAQIAGSDTASKLAAPLSGTRGCLHTSTGNEAVMSPQYSHNRCLASSGSASIENCSR